MSIKRPQPYRFTLRGDLLRWSDRSKSVTHSVHDGLHVVLTYRRALDGKIDRLPTIVAAYKTVESARKEIRDHRNLRRWEGQSFIIHAIPGDTEVTEAPVVPTNLRKVS